MTCRPARPLIAFLALLLLAFALAAPSRAWAEDEVVGNCGIILKMSEKGAPTARECTLGAAAADAARWAAGTDIAVICGGDLYRNLLPGERTWGEIQDVFSTQQQLGTATLSAGELYALLEHSVSCAVLEQGTEDLDLEASSFYGFPQISGFTLEYDMSARPGDRVYFLALEGGDRIRREDDRAVTLCAPVALLSGAYGFPAFSYTPLDLTEAEALAGYIAQGRITSSFTGTGRVVALSTSDNYLVSRYPLVIALVLLILLMIAFAPLSKRRFDRRRERLMADVWNASREETPGESQDPPEEGQRQ